MAVKKKFNTKNRPHALGRGLDALISTDAIATSGSSTINAIPLNQIERNPDQPRTEFDETALFELATSIRELGIIQPITLRELGPKKYQIIAGERRFRASQIAGLEAIPAYIRTAEDEKIMEMALIENIQREDLNAIEIALAFNHLMKQNGMTQDEISQHVGKSRTAIANYIRLLKLPAEIQLGLQKRSIDMGHARALLALEKPEQQIALYKDIVRYGYTVRKVEEIIQQIKSGADLEDLKKKSQTRNLPKQYITVKKHLSDLFETDVQMTYSVKGKGKISFPFKNDEQLKYILEQFEKIQ